MSGFNQNSIKDFITVIHNLIHIDFTIFFLQMSIQIGNVSKQGKIYINKQITIMVGTRRLGRGAP